MKAWLTTSVDTGVNQIPARTCVVVDEDQSRYVRDNFGLLRATYKGADVSYSDELPIRRSVMNAEGQKSHWIIYDERAIVDTDDAVVFDCCDTLEEAKYSAPHYGGCVIVLTTWNEAKGYHEENIVAHFDARGREIKTP